MIRLSAIPWCITAVGARGEHRVAERLNLHVAMKPAERADSCATAGSLSQCSENMLVLVTLGQTSLIIRVDDESEKVGAGKPRTLLELSITKIMKQHKINERTVRGPGSPGSPLSYSRKVLLKW